MADPGGRGVRYQRCGNDTLVPSLVFIVFLERMMKGRRFPSVDRRLAFFSETASGRLIKRS
jgi:hypothetical protein